MDMEKGLFGLIGMLGLGSDFDRGILRLSGFGTLILNVTGTRHSGAHPEAGKNEFHQHKPAD